MNNHTQNRNSKKIAIFVPAATLLVAVALIVAGLLLTRTNVNDASQPASIGIKDARALHKDDKCLANDATTKSEVQAQKGLSEDGGFWTSYIYDVPAGTNVDVNVATYNGSDTITGSLAYSDQYGSYNFIATKQADGWRYTHFANCQ